MSENDRIREAIASLTELEGDLWDTLRNEHEIIFLVESMARVQRNINKIKELFEVDENEFRELVERKDD